MLDIIHILMCSISMYVISLDVICMCMYTITLPCNVVVTKDNCMLSSYCKDMHKIMQVTGYMLRTYPKVCITLCEE